VCSGLASERKNRVNWGKDAVRGQMLGVATLFLGRSDAKNSLRPFSKAKMVHGGPCKKNLHGPRKRPVSKAWSMWSTWSMQKTKSARVYENKIVNERRTIFFKLQKWVDHMDHVDQPKEIRGYSGPRKNNLHGPTWTNMDQTKMEID